jgi:hypothetical protein
LVVLEENDDLLFVLGNIDRDDTNEVVVQVREDAVLELIWMMKILIGWLVVILRDKIIGWLQLELVRIITGLVLILRKMIGW